MSMTTVSNIVAGKFGFYPCEHGTYIKLKRLNLLCFLHNKQWTRNEDGNKTSFVYGNQIPEPKNGCDAFSTKIVLGQNNPWHKTPITDIVEVDYRKARYPSKIDSEVKSLILSITEIDKLLIDAEKWFSR